MSSNINKQIVSFIRNLYGTDGFIPLSVPYLGGNEKKYLNECIDINFISSVGEFVDLFELKIAQFTGAKTAVVCVNGTSALHMALILVGVKSEDEVLTQALTFVATCNVISYIGAHPVFIDVDEQTLGMSPISLRIWLENNAQIQHGKCYNKKSNRRIKACVPMHTFGHPCRIDEIASICKEWYIELVEDAAESIGSLYKGCHTGLFGKVGVVSFNGNKTITTGGGGVLLFRDEHLGKFAKHLTTQAKVPHKWEFVHDHVGYNYRMPNINAALGCAQLENIDFILKNKRKTSEYYRDFFLNIPNVSYVEEPIDCFSNYWLNAIILQDKQAQEDFLQYSNEHGIMSRPVWRLMNKLSMFKGCQTDGLKTSIWLADRIVNIPSSVRLNI